MNTAIRFGMVGFVAGLAMALALSQISLQQVIPPEELHVLWPTASLGLDFSGWTHGDGWESVRLLLSIFGNGAVYAVVACCLGGVVELVRK